MDMRRLVGGNTARIRKEQGLTQEALAEKSGLSQQYISGLESGHRNPTIVTLFELANALGVSHVELVQPLRTKLPDKKPAS
jgi:transcriptional regulator with XRE-family HTH domain